MNVPVVSDQRLLSLETRIGTGPAECWGVEQMSVPGPWKMGITSMLSNLTRSAGLSTKLAPITATRVPPLVEPQWGTTSATTGATVADADGFSWVECERMHIGLDCTVAMVWNSSPR
eukprot:Mycagemm_TRINITY_DN9312_c0_g2::TRINITY_DN9312_c0_g2_i1::g.3267::m.3267 type:complete len:117 gc:universal TRINITY_DN9312_c0_g2_i1:716-366(-)